MAFAFAADPVLVTCQKLDGIGLPGAHAQATLLRAAAAGLGVPATAQKSGALRPHSTANSVGRESDYGANGQQSAKTPPLQRLTVAS